MGRFHFWRRAMIRQHIIDIQKLYPRIYMACHVDHVNARSNPAELSARDATVLAHLSESRWRRPGPLAAHLNIAASTLSEALHGLAGRGFVLHKQDDDDQRKSLFRLSAAGVQAMQDASVLDSERLQQVLKRMNEKDRMDAVRGLKLLADAAAALNTNQ